LMVLNATFNNMSVISWRSFVLVEETGVPGENHQPDNHKRNNFTLYNQIFPYFVFETTGLSTVFRFSY